MRVTLHGSWIGVLLLSTSSLAAAAGPAAPMDTSLASAVRSANKAAVRALIQKKADVNLPDPDGTTPLHWAVGRDDLETTNLLIKAGAKVGAANRYGVTPLLRACETAGPAVVEALLNAGADANSALPEGEAALMVAARTGKAEVVKILV